ncbi:DUF4190 domain-containing protein [Agreia sp.]|uniref:DUF4190 domain-containing protein n=1 Tax=Agreia sp. TaxID=1872416 RepID=UPI0035BBEE4E
MPDTQPPAFPGAPDEPTTPASPGAPEAPSAPPARSTPQFPTAPPVADYGTPPPTSQSYPQPTQAYPPSNQYASAPYPAAPYAPGTISPKKGPGGLALSALIIGAVALIGSFIPFLNYVTGFLAFVGLVLGVIAIFLKARKKTLAIVASAVSLLALILSIVLSIVYTGLFFSSVSDTIESDYPSITSEPVEPDDDTSTGEQGAPVVGDVGSRENPAPLGSSIELAQLGEPTWQVTVNTPTLNADAAVAAENSFSDTAPAGTSYALLPVTTTYIGSETGFPAYVQVAFEAADGTMYNQYDVLAIAPDALDAISELTPGASATGNIAIAIPTSGVEQGFWVVSSLDGTKFYFAAQ